MAQLMQHEKHGLQYALSGHEQTVMESNGWVVCKEHPAIAKSRALQEAIPRRGRPPLIRSTPEVIAELTEVITNDNSYSDSN